MTLPGKVIQATADLKGFDANQHISAAQAKAFHDAGHRFCLRYVPRHDTNPGDLTRSEAQLILAAGLALMVVQHVKNPPWVPSGALGTAYGANAASSCDDIGVQLGTTVWCDLEGVAAAVDARDVVAFCNNWHTEVGKAGYTPGLYVGFDPGLSADWLYRKLRFEHYWSAYNLNADQVPLVRGVQMRQGVEKVLAGVRYDPDIIQADRLGGLPLMHVDNEWTAE